MKYCNKCNQTLPFTMFSRNTNQCKTCKTIYLKQYVRTKIGLISCIYSGQKRSSKVRNHPAPTYSRQELEEWLVKQPLFNKLYLAWVASEYATKSIPSCDRLDDTKGYSLSNLQLVTWKENHQNGIDKGYYKKALANSRKTRERAVNQYDMQGVFIAYYPTILLATKAVKGQSGNISRVCSGQRKQAYGFKWQYANPECQALVAIAAIEAKYGTDYYEHD